MKTTYELIGERIEKGNKKELFDMIYSNTAQSGSTLIEFESEVSETFCKDIATRVNESILQGHTPRISEKQSWCLVFDLLKNADKYNGWVNGVIESLEGITI